MPLLVEQLEHADHALRVAAREHGHAEHRHRAVPRLRVPRAVEATVLVRVRDADRFVLDDAAADDRLLVEVLGVAPANDDPAAGAARVALAEPPRRRQPPGSWPPGQREPACREERPEEALGPPFLMKLYFYIFEIS